MHAKLVQELPSTLNSENVSDRGANGINPDSIIEKSSHQDNSPTRSSLCSTIRLDGVELIENIAVNDTSNVDASFINLNEKLPDIAPPNSTIKMTPTKLYGLVALFSTIFLVIGIGIGVLVGSERFQAVTSNELVSDVPALQPTSYPTETLIISGSGPCSDTFKFSTLSNAFFVNATRLQADCSIADVAPFMNFLLAALRIESITGNLLALLGLCVIVQLGGIPSVTKGDEFNLPGLLMWLIWISFSVLQYITIFIAQLMDVLAVFSFVGQYEDELVTLQGGLGTSLGAAIGAGVGVVIGGVIYLKDAGVEISVQSMVVPCAVCAASTVLGVFYGSFTDATFFVAIIPSLIFHPTFVAKNAALSVYAFTIFQGIAASKIIAFNIDKAMQLYAIVMVAPLLAIGMFYFVFTISLIFSLVFFVPMSLCLAIVFLVSWYVLKLAKKGSQESIRIALQSVECDLNYLNPLKPLDGALWWLPDSLISTITDGDVVAHSAMLLMVLFSAVLIVLSPLLVFGHWAAFYSYLGRPSSRSMAFVALTYEHLFGVFLDVDFNVPDLVNFNFDDISECFFLFANIPRFDELPPAAMLEGSATFSALSLLLSLIEPLVCLFSFILSIAGLVGENKKVGKVAEVLGSYEGIFNGLVGLECISALQMKNDKWDCKLDDDGNIIELRVPENTVLDIGALANCKALTKFYATGIGISGDISVLVNCPSLLVFDVQMSAGVTGDIVVLKTCPKIEIFAVGGFYGCMITGDIKVFENTPDVSHIYLKNTSSYGDIAVLADAKSLLAFNASATKITGDIGVLGTCNSLTELNISNCEQITGDIKVFESCNKLQRIDISGSMFLQMSITGDIKVFKNTLEMTSIDLENTKCTGKSIPKLFFS